MQLAKSHIASIASQNLRLRYPRRIANLIGISEHEFARFQRALVRIRPGNAAAFDGGMADAILEAEWFLLIRGNVTILPPECRDSRQLLIGFPSAVAPLLHL